MGRLVVVLGAGASSDCLQESQDGYAEHTPPLARELFDRRFSHILDTYPLAQIEAADVRFALSSGTVGLEDHLLSLRDATHDGYGQQRWREIPLYLQHLLFHLSLPRHDSARHGGFTNQAGNYDRLASAALRLEEVVFVTLNYDTILDRRLARYRGSTPPESLDWYVEPGRNWSLVKLHGSVNWGYAVLNQMTPRASPTGNGVNTVTEFGESLKLDTVIKHLGNPPTIEGMRWANQPDGIFHYPALSVPLGPVDGLSCPQSHQDSLRDRLSEMAELNLLVVGYSGLDQSVVRFLKASNRPLGKVRIVNGSQEYGLAAADSLAKGLEQSLDPGASVFAGGFRQFMASHEFDEFLESL